MNPTDAVLAITYQCNSRCVMCNIWQQPRQKELKPEDYQKLPKTLKDINLSGGEPFLRRDLLAVIENILKVNPQVRIIISTNGLAPELIQEQMREIIKIKPDIGVAVSLDGLGEVHTQVRRVPQAYEKVLQTIAKLKELKVKHIKLAFTAGDYNADHLMKVYYLSRALGVEFTLAVVHQATHYFATDMKVNEIDKIREQLDALIKEELKSISPKRWARAYFAFGLYKLLKQNKRILPNYSGLASFFMDPRGNVFPSDVSDFKMGNILENKPVPGHYRGLEDIFDPRKEKEIFHQVNFMESPNWMICTARTAIKKHPFRVLSWILKAKLLGAELNGCKHSKQD